MEERNIYLDDLDVIKNLDGTYTICHKDSGEIIDAKDSVLDDVIKDERKQTKLNKAKIKAINTSRGIIEKTDTHYINWKSKSHFIKTYRTEMREYKSKVKLSPSAGLLLWYIQDYIEFGTNKVAKTNGSNLNNADIEELTGLSTKTISSSLKELEDKLFIKRVGSGSAREIYFNPYLACPGNEVEIKTADVLFKEYKSITSY